MKILLFLILLTQITGCMTSGHSADTPEKVLFAAEKSWKGTLETVQKNITRMSADQKLKVGASLKKGNDALRAARLALSISNNTDFTNNMGLLNASLDVMRALLEELENNEVSYGYNIKHYHPA